MQRVRAVAQAEDNTTPTSTPTWVTRPYNSSNKTQAFGRVTTYGTGADTYYMMWVQLVENGPWVQLCRIKKNDPSIEAGEKAAFDEAVAKGKGVIIDFTGVDTDTDGHVDGAGIGGVTVTP